LIERQIAATHWLCMLTTLKATSRLSTNCTITSTMMIEIR
jgi:hypothetical protein